ncbi:histone H1-like repetitive region-containing protein [Kitasatospora sp. NPDC087861]|uniref:histone H1-like repetitive region-containing protein n=1 Tax=Kitasatospora sp. NPDC087861 TaxID=3364070 RepID=UPI003801D9A7
MLPRTVRGVVEVAAGLVEEVGKRVVGTAATILERSGVDVTEVERRLGGQFPPSAKTLQTLAEEAVTAGRAGVDLAVGVARGEVEKAFERVGDQVTKVGVVLAYLESKLREVEEDAVPAAGPAGSDEADEEDEAERPTPAPRADDLFGRGWESADGQAAAWAVGEPIVAERVEVDEPVEVDPPVPPVRPAVARKAAAKRTPAKKAPAADRSTAGGSAAEKTSAEKAEKASAKRTTAKKAPAKKSAAKKTTVKKTAVKKTSAAKKAAAEPAAQPKAPAKRTATKKTTVRKATSTKKPDDRTS